MNYEEYEQDEILLQTKGINADKSSSKAELLILLKEKNKLIAALKHQNAKLLQDLKQRKKYRTPLNDSTLIEDGGYPSSSPEMASDDSLYDQLEGSLDYSNARDQSFSDGSLVERDNDAYREDLARLVEESTFDRELKKAGAKWNAHKECGDEPHPPKKFYLYSTPCTRDNNKIPAVSAAQQEKMDKELWQLLQCEIEKDAQQEKIEI